MFQCKRFTPIIISLVTISCLALSGCAKNKIVYTEAEQQQITEHQALVDQAQKFVHANLFAGMIQVWNTDRAAWNAYLNAQLCGAVDKAELIAQTSKKNLPIFVSNMTQVASHQALFLEPNEQAALEDVAQLAYQLFSTSYAKGYARQVSLADEMSPGMQEEMCQGRVLTDEQQNEVNTGLRWTSFTTPVLAKNNGLNPHAQNGEKAFQQLLQQQYAQFDALVYSHAYQQSEAYQVLFFEVNKYENVQSYGEHVSRLSGTALGAQNSQFHDDFAYLILSSGFHWGMLSVLAVLEEEYPRLHDRKKQQAAIQIKTITQEIEAKNQQG
ncbi:hypothetical protein [Aliiglaciecola sp. M165]|uniref:hypothetical protein n=1 Tax=Aliiglaciecola sp. M165 TaxID=2593649 RepID=UPI00117C90AA|nr:hypothetical protein [Aliiglaciecola sp. M165]TRY29908.1 hypothetical protein FM019_17235 [Aliiglaciecola sp. M165]